MKKLAILLLCVGFFSVAVAAEKTNKISDKQISEHAKRQSLTANFCCALYWFCWEMNYKHDDEKKEGFTSFTDSRKK